MKVVAMALLAILWCATPAQSQEVPQQDAQDASRPEAVRAMVNAGLAPEKAQRLATAMAKGGLSREQVQRIAAMLSEMKQQGLSVDPVLSKIQEGLAKRVPAGRIVSALEKVAARHMLATVTSRELPGNKRQREEIRRTIVDGLAAGIKTADMQQIMQQLQERMRQMSASESAALALETSRMARDMSRVGAPSEATREVIDQALGQRFDAREMQSLRDAFMQETPRRPPAEVAAGFTRAIQSGTPPDQLQQAPLAPAPPPPNPTQGTTAPAPGQSGGGRHDSGRDGGGGQGPGGGHR